MTPTHSDAMSDGALPSGQLRITIRRANGTTERHLVKNRILTAGRAFIAERMIGTPAVVSHMGVGTGTTAVADGDTALRTQLGARVAVTAAVNGNVVTYTAELPPGTATGALTEAGLFTSATAGRMTCRSVFGVKTKDPGDHITINWDNIINPPA